MVQATSLVETCLNIKQQFDIDIDETGTALISKNITFFAFQFPEKMFLNAMFENVKSI